MPTLIRILMPALRAKDGRRQIHVVFHEPYTELAEPVRRALGSDKTVVIVDRRTPDDRRRQQRPVPLEWRRAERRRSMVTVADIVME